MNIVKALTSEFLGFYIKNNVVNYLPVMKGELLKQFY